MAQQALAGVRVLDLTQAIAGPYCTKLLADYGADVIKIERPGAGDRARRLGPFHHDHVHLERSGLFWHLNANKRSITLNLKSSTGRKIFFELLEGADAVVESFAPRVMPGLGLDYEALSARRPRLVMTSISNFGQSGPYRDYKSSEMITYAMGGPMHATGLPEREPVKMGGNVLQYQAGAVAASATAIALWNAECAGAGDHLDVSLFRCQVSCQDRRTTMLIGYQYTGENMERKTAGASAGTGVRPCADGYVNIMGATLRLPRVMKMIGREDLANDPRFATPLALAQPGSAEAFDEYYIPFLMQYTKRELFTMAQAHGLASGPLYDSSDLLSDPHFRGRGFWQTVEHEGIGAVEQPGRPFIMNETPWQLRRPAPRLGQHSAEILCGMLGYSTGDLVRLKQLGIV